MKKILVLAALSATSIASAREPLPLEPGVEYEETLSYRTTIKGALTDAQARQFLNVTKDPSVVDALNDLAQAPFVQQYVNAGCVATASAEPICEVSWTEKKGGGGAASGSVGTPIGGSAELKIDGNGSSEISFTLKVPCKELHSVIQLLRNN